MVMTESIFPNPKKISTGKVHIKYLLDAAPNFDVQFINLRPSDEMAQ